jgi:hypothetical protein
MANYSASIDYARINSNNTLLAQSNDGAGDGSNATITEVIDSPSNSGKFISPTVVPTGNTVTCTSDVSTTFEEGQYLFYFDASANPILIGQIDSIATTVITLTANIIGSGAAMANKELGSSYGLISANEEFYIRVSTSVISGSGNSSVYLPNISNWRNQPSNRNASTVKNSVSNIVQYSNVGTPLSIAGTQQPVSFTIRATNVFLSPNSGANYFSNIGQLPQYIWLRATPIPNTGQTSGFNPSTMYRFSTNEFMEDAVVATINTPFATLFDAGYNVTQPLISQTQQNQGSGN